MKYEVITDRFEIEKMAEEVFLSSDSLLTHIDYPDLCILRRAGVFKEAAIFDIDELKEGWIDELIETIQSLQHELDSLRACMLNIIVGDGDLLLCSDVAKIRQFLINIKADGGDANTSDNHISCLWSVRVSSSMPNKSLQVQLLSAYERTEQDMQEEERYREMIEVYRKQFLPPLDFPEIDTTSDDNDLLQI
ncbi:MAG: hypothetical protein IKA49_02655 [Alistipes sp.]|nr:hypothetical protein [Alistipes sp.]